MVPPEYWGGETDFRQTQHLRPLLRGTTSFLQTWDAAGTLSFHFLYRFALTLIAFIRLRLMFLFSWFTV
jgi:hypothetical protein